MSLLPYIVQLPSAGGNLEQLECVINHRLVTKILLLFKWSGVSAFCRCKVVSGHSVWHIDNWEVPTCSEIRFSVSADCINQLCVYVGWGGYKYA